jgi:surfactin synthase thioesterase subunit
MSATVETLQSDLLQAEVPFAVILPEGEGSFPVLYDLHGLLSDEGPYDPAPTEREYFERQPFRNLQSIANETGVAIVRVNGGRGWYLDSPRIKKSQYQSHIVEELIPHVESAFPISEPRGISGHSMGGMGAINLLCRYPQLFSVGAIHCASLRFMPGDQYGSYIEDLMSDEELCAAFPDDFLNALVRDDLKLRVTVGADDKERIVRENRTLHQFLLENQHAHMYEETPGGHEYILHGLNGVVWAAQQLRASQRDAE